MLRSKRPELVEQEFYALLLVHAAIRHLMTEAAAQTGQAAQVLSFIHAVASSIAASRQSALFPPRGRPVWFQSVLGKSLLAAPSPAAANATRAEYAEK